MTEVLAELEAPKFVHLHIPKTAGTSLRRAFRDTYGPHHVLYYDNTHDRVIRSSFHISGSEKDSMDSMKQSVYQNRLFRAALPLFRIVRASENVLAFDPIKIAAKNYSVLTGHFNASQLAQWGVDDLPIVTLVRDPLERTWSQYRHWHRSEGQAGFVPDNSLAFSSDVSFEEFASQESVTNYQSRLLGGLPLKLTGVVEALPEFLEELGINRTPWVNKGLYGSIPEFDSCFRRDFIDRNYKDYDLYQRTIERWDIGSLALTHSA